MEHNKSPEGYSDNLHGHNFETTTAGEKLYNVELLEHFAEQLPTQEIPLSKLQEAVAKGSYYWTDKNGDLLGPFQILQDWEAAQHNDAYTEHVATIQRANLSSPIWITADGQVFNGAHRLTRAFIDGSTTIKAKVFAELPESAIVKT